MNHPADGANGYEQYADEFISRRAASTIGVAAVRAWARSLAPGATILDLGCGSGQPITEALYHDGFAVHGIDASPTLVAACRQRFPEMPIACEAVEASRFFERPFDGVLAVGLLFLLTEEAQRTVIRKVAAALTPGGRFLFTAPSQRCEWTDVLTGRESRSLGGEAYVAALADVGLRLLAESEDEGGNHYYDAIAG